jgi:CheY-like chemotaxis protein
MSKSDDYVLVLEKQADPQDVIRVGYREIIRDIASTYSPKYNLEFVEKIEDAYWSYLEKLENSGTCKLVLIDLNLEGQSQGSHFDGIDLALAIHKLSQKKGVETPWVVALAAADPVTDADIVDCFFDLAEAVPRMAVIRKSIDQLEVRLSALFSALGAGDAAKYPEFSRGGRSKRSFEIEPLDDEVLMQLVRMDNKISKDGCEKLLNEISKEALNSYRYIKFAALAPGFSGSGILSATARRRNDPAEARTFVIKICRDNKKNKNALQKLDDEFDKYVRRVKLIRKHVPLLIGFFEIDGWKFIVYEFISYMGIGVRTFGDNLRTALEHSVAPRNFQTSQYGRSSGFIFDKILKNWHEVREAVIENPDTNSFYEGWFQGFLTNIRKKIIGVYPHIEPDLLQNQLYVDLNLGLGSKTLRLVNPFHVVNSLLSRNGESYWEHSLQYGIIHGDLHSGNILQSMTVTGFHDEWKLIDFANIYEVAHLAQDGARLECDIKFQKILPINLENRFVLEVYLATNLDQDLSRSLGKILDVDVWSKKWDKISKVSNDYGLVERQIIDIRQPVLRTLSDNNDRASYSEHLDYTIALLIQSLIFVNYLGNPIKILHAWLSACLTATLVHQYSVHKREEKTKGPSLSRSARG